MKRFFVIGGILLTVVFAMFFLLSYFDNQSFEKEPVANVSENKTRSLNVTPTTTPRVIPDEYMLGGGIYAGQTFNNCGPASLSMALSYQGREVSQAELANILRPFNNPLGGVDDKAVFATELVEEAKRQGFESIERPNGTISMLQELLAEDVSIIVRTWLNPGEDIGHYRVLTGYNRTTKEIYMDDSYNGPNLSMDEETFLDLWQPFNYGYILVYPQEKSRIVSDIVGEDMDETEAWQNARDRADRELGDNANDAYAVFNKAVAFYYLGDPSETTRLYESVASELPRRMLWYQIEPIYAYYETEKFDQANMHINSILSGGNQAFSELYVIRGDILKAQGNIEGARSSYEKAVEYNTNSDEARTAFQNLQR